MALRVLAAITVLAATGALGMSCAWRREFQRGGTSAPQDPETGIMRGAEPVRLEAGNDRACLLLHGWLTGPADFGDLPEALGRAGWDVHAPLLYGHGTHPRAMLDITADKMLDTAREQYEELQARYDRVALIGFSAGGAVATLLARERLPDRLVLVAPFLGLRYRWYYVLPPRWWQRMVAPAVPYIGRSHRLLRINRKEGLERLVTYTVYPTAANDAPFELLRRLLEGSGPDVPVLLVYAPGDDVCSPGAELEFFGRLPGGSNSALACPNSNHHILNDYDREAAVQAIVEFLEGAE